MRELLNQRFPKVMAGRMWRRRWELIRQLNDHKHLNLLYFENYFPLLCDKMCDKLCDKKCTDIRR